MKRTDAVQVSRSGYVRSWCTPPIHRPDREGALRVDSGCLTGRWAGAERKMQGHPNKRQRRLSD
jgi:hypothetical protein